MNSIIQSREYLEMLKDLGIYVLIKLENGPPHRVEGFIRRVDSHHFQLNHDDSYNFSRHRIISITHSGFGSLSNKLLVRLLCG